MKKSLPSLFSLLVVLFLAGCVSIDPPKISHQGTDVRFLSVQEALAVSHFSIKNTNPINLRGMVEYELFVKGQRFSSGVSSTIEVGANSESTFSIQSRIDIIRAFGVVTDLINEIQAGKSSVPFQINGKFKSDVVGIPVEAPVSASGNIPLPKLQDLLHI
jgi:hypothetical protein